MADEAAVAAAVPAASSAASSATFQGTAARPRPEEVQVRAVADPAASNVDRLKLLESKINKLLFFETDLNELGSHF